MSNFVLERLFKCDKFYDHVHMSVKKKKCVLSVQFHFNNTGNNYLF